MNLRDIGRNSIEPLEQNDSEQIQEGEENKSQMSMKPESNEECKRSSCSEFSCIPEEI